MCPFVTALTFCGNLLAIKVWVPEFGQKRPGKIYIEIRQVIVTAKIT